MTDSKISNLPAATTLSDTDDLVVASSGTSKKITGANLRAAMPHPLGQVFAVEAYVEHDVTTGSLPVIDGAQTLEGSIVYLNFQSDLVQNGLWVVHGSSAWERPTWFADGMEFLSGQIVHCVGGNGEIQFNKVFITFDNATNADLPFTVGTDPINSDSVINDDGLPPAGFPNVVQGQFAALWFGSTDSTSILGAGAWLWSNLGRPGYDAAQLRLVNLPEPTVDTEAATKLYVDTAVALLRAELAP